MSLPLNRLSELTVWFEKQALSSDRVLLGFKRSIQNPGKRPTYDRVLRFLSRADSWSQSERLHDIQLMKALQTEKVWPELILSPERTRIPNGYQQAVHQRKLGIPVTSYVDSGRRGGEVVSFRDTPEGKITRMDIRTGPSIPTLAHAYGHVLSDIATEAKGGRPGVFNEGVAMGGTKQLSRKEQIQRLYDEIRAWREGRRLTRQIFPDQRFTKQPQWDLEQKAALATYKRAALPSRIRSLNNRYENTEMLAENV